MNLGTPLAIVVLAGVLASPAPAAASTRSSLSKSDFRDVVSGDAPRLRVRAVLTEVNPLAKKPKRSAARAAKAAVAACDVARVAKLRTIATTTRDADAPEACVVLEQRGEPKTRYLLGPSRLTGSGVDAARPKREPAEPTKNGKKKRKSKEFIVDVSLTDTGLDAFNTFAREQFHQRIAVVLDGAVLATPMIWPEEDSFAEFGGLWIEPDGRGFDRGTAAELASLVERSKLEEVIRLAKQTTMTKSALQTFAGSRPQVDDRTVFNDDCPNLESADTLVLGCYGDHRIFILRVERPDLAPVMSVTTAHEMLHAAYDDLPKRERRRINGLLDEFFAGTTDARLKELVAEYERTEPGQRLNELHSLVPTQIADLPPALERYYKRYFHDRPRVVADFESYQKVFDDLQARADQLSSEIGALDAQLNDLNSQIEGAGAEADRLTNEIDALRRQGRIDESNRLVGAQNAAVDRANGLVATFNGLVSTFNEKVAQLDAVAIAQQVLYEAITPIAPR